MRKHLRILAAAAAILFLGCSQATVGLAQTGKKDSQELDAAMTWFYSEVATTHTPVVLFDFYDPNDKDSAKQAAMVESIANTWRNQVTLIKVDVTQHRLVQARFLSGDLLEKLPYLLCVDSKGTILNQHSFEIGNKLDPDAINEQIEDAIRTDLKIQK
jgi:hypothetical protein